MDETSILAITVSAIAIKVVHCDSVNGSPSGGDGRGASRGAMKLSCVVVMVARVQCNAIYAAGCGENHFPGIQGTTHYMGRLFQPADIPLGSCTPNWSARTLGGLAWYSVDVQKRGLTSATIAILLRMRPFLGIINPFGVQVR